MEPYSPGWGLESGRLDSGAGGGWWGGGECVECVEWFEHVLDMFYTCVRDV